MDPRRRVSAADHLMSGGVPLREVQGTGLPNFFEHQRDPSALQIAGFGPRERAEYFSHWAGILANPSMGTPTVLADDAVAGKVVCFERSGVWLVGFWLGRAQWGRSIAAESRRVFLMTVPTSALHALVATQNFVSIRALQKFGFVACTAPTLPEYGLGDASRDQTNECCMVLCATMECER